MADFDPGFYTAHCRPPSSGSTQHVIPNKQIFAAWPPTGATIWQTGSNITSFEAAVHSHHIGNETVPVSLIFTLPCARRQRRTDPRPRIHFLKFERVIFEIHERAYKQTDRQRYGHAHNSTLHLYWGKVNMNTFIDTKQNNNKYAAAVL